MKNVVVAVSDKYEAKQTLKFHSDENVFIFALSLEAEYFLESNIKHFGFHPERRTNAVRIRRKAEVYKFMDLISFRKYPLL